MGSDSFFVHVSLQMASGIHARVGELAQEGPCLHWFSGVRVLSPALAVHRPLLAHQQTPSLWFAKYNRWMSGYTVYCGDSLQPVCPKP